jgi:hypothetical protein
MTHEPDPPRSDAWWEGYRLGEAHRATGEMACICGDSQEALDKAAGYAAGRREHQADAEIDMEAGP